MNLNTCIDYINKALNFPGQTLEDLDVFFDMAFAELNTTLHISIPTLSEQLKLFEHFVSKNDVTVYINDDLEASPEIKVYSTLPNSQQEDVIYVTSDRCFYTWDRGVSKYTKVTSRLIATHVIDGEVKHYMARVYSAAPLWVTYKYDVEQYDLNNILTDDWILLWLIPYICFKYTVKDGGTATTFAEELSQGFQQLQESYNVPHKLTLATVADKLVYTEDVKECLEHNMSLNRLVETKLILKQMKHARGTIETFEDMFDRGGFGL